MCNSEFFNFQKKIENEMLGPVTITNIFKCVRILQVLS